MNSSSPETSSQPTVINKGPQRIVVFDHLDPESTAMVQALYSRSPRSVIDHLDKVAEVGPEKFMGQFYVGYGHKSIGDCGSTTICLEGVSLLVAKAVQDWALYNGQEASTRYLDMSKQPLIDPLGTKESAAILAQWMSFYNRTLQELIPVLKAEHPRQPEQNEVVWEKAIKARAFDIARGFLPASAATFVSWHTNLRQAHDHIHQLEHHPLAEVQKVAALMRQVLTEKYPSSFSHKTYPEQEKYYAATAKQHTYFDDTSIKKFSIRASFDKKILARYKKALASRPIKTELPAVMRNAGNVVFRFLLDFGSYRDLQRQRSMISPMPLLTVKHSFHPWYLERLPAALRAEAVTFLREQIKRIKALKVSAEERQYYIAMGYQVACEVTASLPAAVYIAELRAGQTVHPTLRIVAQQMGQALKNKIRGIALHHDMSPDSWSIKRGQHDIVQKPSK